MASVSFLLNGQKQTVADVSPTMTVLDWLRSEAKLTGTKEGCAEGDCGACTIVVARPDKSGLNYQAVNSCLMIVPQLDGCAALTVEGVAEAGALHPVQQAMIEADATQCGFCTPGFVMAAFAYKHDGGSADDAGIHEALAGNLCRCTGYRSIVDACRKIAQAPPDSFDAKEAETIESLKRLSPCSDYQTDGQRLIAPRTIDALLAAIDQNQTARILGGGTDLGLRFSKDREQWPLTILIGAVAELRRISEDKDALTIGGAATYTDALPYLDKHFAPFADLVRRIGSRQIRNLGTLAGNLATASPIGDTLPCLMALGATIVVRSKSGERTLPIESFLVGYRKTALQPGEIIAAIRIPYLPKGRHFAAYKVSKRFDQDISTVVAALMADIADGKVRDIRLAFGGMAARTARANTTEVALRGKPWTIEALSEIDSTLAKDFTPIGDQRGGAVYRLRAAAGLIRRFQIETTQSALSTRVEVL